jgi:hypothetical protein
MFPIVEERTEAPGFFFKAAQIDSCDEGCQLLYDSGANSATNTAGSEDSEASSLLCRHRFPFATATPIWRR